MSVTRLVPIPAGCAALLAVLVYLNALDNPFVYDDFRLIVENASILSLRDIQFVILRDVTRPVVNLSYAIDTAFWGPRPFGYHLTSVLLHALNVVLVFWVAFVASEDARRQTATRAWTGLSATVIAFITAAFFAVHPMMTQAVGYVASRSEVMYSACFLLAFLAGRKWLHDGGARWWLTCIALWIVALLAKETAAMLPVVLLAYDWFVLDAGGAARRRRLLRLHVPILAGMLIAGTGRLAVLMFVEYDGQTDPDWRFMLIAVDAFWRYVALFFVPRGQAIFHDVPLIDGLFSVRALSGLAGLAAFAGLIWTSRRVHSLLAFGLLWFAVLLVPSGVLAMFGRGEPMAEHRAYLPAAGLFLAWGCAFGALWARAAKYRMLAAGTAAIFLASLALLTIVRNVIWDDPVVLSREAVTLAPRHWLPRTLLAESLRQSGRCEEAVAEYRTVIAMRPMDAFAHTALVRCLVETGELDDAIRVLRRLRAVSPASPDAAMGLGLIALLRSRPGEARFHYQEALEKDGGHVQARRMMAFLDRALPDTERRRICDELGTLAGGRVSVDLCRS
jgi:pentatricopeptide repeat protein